MGNVFTTRFEADNHVKLNNPLMGTETDIVHNNY